MFLKKNFRFNYSLHIHHNIYDSTGTFIFGKMYWLSYRGVVHKLKENPELKLKNLTKKLAEQTAHLFFPRAKVNAQKNKRAVLIKIISLRKF
jgi:hypothetical protein